ncbi:hypothetical protein [Arsenophonus endosymbiont of Bemisia tabaci]|uniref:hypothetical protein n=1 Tax=Arsenophonus endosymbiont of Bemisia tabaci TaxID=536059 RepID=UPI0015F4DAAE|nr:hypothetical protein [Arsenophonus endosymbiont of Bemisia tabaci]
MQKKSAWMRHRYFVRTQYGVIKIKSLSYNCSICLNNTIICVQLFVISENNFMKKSNLPWYF